MEKLDGSIKAQLHKALAQRLYVPHVPSVRLSDVGYRLVYQVIDPRLVVLVIAIGRRDHDAAYPHRTVTSIVRFAL